MKYNKREIMLRAWQLIKSNKEYTLSTALKQSWKEIKSKNNINVVYKENLQTIKNMCWRYSNFYKLDYNDMFSKTNELFIKIYNKYTYDKIGFKKFLYIQLNNYLKMYGRKEILRSNRENLIYFQNTSPIEIKKQKKKELSELSKKILNYCIEENTKKETIYNIRKYKDKVYKYPVKIKNITMKNIKNYFKQFYSSVEIQDAFNEIKYILKKELI